MTQHLYDISPPLTETTKVFPGDTPLDRDVLMDIARGDHVTVSTLRGTVHLGAHADAPSHYGRAGRTIDQQPLALYIGLCMVMPVQMQRNQLIQPHHLPPSDVALPPRVLLSTGTFPDPTVWNDDFAALAPETVDVLADRGVKLVGIDTPSVDPATSKELPAHARFLARDVAILEGLMLCDVPPGMYELIALPLRLVGFDGSPVRAVLRGHGFDPSL
ncbi:MAG: cyclase family protein [Phycisphaerales bacterium]